MIVNRVPDDSFTVDEARELEAFIARQPVFGADSFHRIQQARRAVARLHEATAIPTIELPDCEETGNALLERLTVALQAAKFATGGAR